MSRPAAMSPPPIGTGKGGAGGWNALLEVIEQETRELLAEARKAVPDDVRVEATMISGDPVQALIGAGQAPGTLMVAGSRGYGPLRRVLLGSVSMRGMGETAEREPAGAVGAAL